MKNTCKSLLWSVLLGSSAALSTLPAQAFTPFYLTQTFNNPITFNNPPSRGGEFGVSVSIDGVYALIGDENYVNNFGVRISGSAFLFDAVTGNLLQTFNNPNPNLGDDFGSSVSISGTKALVGAHSDDTGATNAGSAYLFDTETGNLLQTFNNPTPQNSDIFGESVSVSGTNALIGAYGDNTGAFRTGSSYLFDTETGNLLQTFNNPTPQDNDFFGYSVSIDGTNALIGAWGDNTGATNAGSAYLFDTETGNLLHTFNNPTPEVGDAFGLSVSIDGTYALIGAYGDNTGAVVAGSAYLFDTVTGNLLHTFNNPTPQLIQSGDSFGFSVSIDGTNALIGAFGDDTGATDAGSAYLFDAVTGNLLQTFNNPFPQLNDYFGDSVSINDTGILIGVRGDQNIRETNVGSAYLYQLDSIPDPDSPISINPDQPSGTPGEDFLELNNGSSDWFVTIPENSLAGSTTGEEPFSPGGTLWDVPHGTGRSVVNGPNLSISIQPPPELTLNGIPINQGTFNLTSIIAYLANGSEIPITPPSPIFANIGDLTEHLLFDVPLDTEVIHLLGFFDPSDPDLDPANFDITIGPLSNTELEWTFYLPAMTNMTTVQVTDLGNGTTLDDNTNSFLDVDGNTTSVPEPSSVFGLFLITGFGILVTKHRS